MFFVVLHHALFLFSSVFFFFKERTVTCNFFSLCHSSCVEIKNKLLLRSAFAEEMKKTKWCKNQAAGRRRQLYNTTTDWNTCDTGRHDGNKMQIAVRITWRAENTGKKKDDKIKGRKCFLLLYCIMHCFCFLPFSSSSKKELSPVIFSACATVPVSK